MDLQINLEERCASMKAFFNWKADGFDDVHLSLMESKVAVTKVLPEGIRRVLDLGVGTGMELYALTERFPGVQITGIDISANMLEYIRNRPFAGQVKCIVGDFFEVEFGEGYDAVISSSALHHFAPEDKAVLYRKVRDCLRPGGWFVNADRFTDTPEETAEFYRYFTEHRYDANHCDTPLHVDLETDLLIGAGMDRIRFDPVMTERGYKLLVCRKPVGNKFEY